MKKNRFKHFFSLIFLALPILSGCGDSLSKGDFEIKLTEIIPVAYVDQSYDFTKILTREEGIHYEISAKYFEPSLKMMVSLPVEDFHFTPITDSDLSVTVNAYNQTYIKSRKVSIRVSIKGDTIDELLATGASNYKDDGVSKSLNLDSNYIKFGKSSIAISYYGNNFYRWGATVLAPNNYRCLNEWSDKEWNNAILTFWVYNPTEYDFEFQLRICETKGLGNVDTDWGQAINVPQFAKAGQWTQLFFSMNKLGINRPLQFSEDGKIRDDLNIKTRWLGTPGSEEFPETYRWQMYADGIDVVDSSVYPEVDTQKDSSSETIAQGWENLPLDTSEKANYGRAKAIYRENVTRTAEFESKSSLYLTFANTDPGNLGYSVAFSPEEENKQDSSFEIPTFNKGTFKADFKFSENITDRSISFLAVEKVILAGGKEDWNVVRINEITLTDLEDGWYRLHFDLAKVLSYQNFGKGIRFGFVFNGVNSSNKAKAEIYVDNIFFDQNGTGPAPQSAGRGEKIAKDLTKVFTKSVSSETGVLIFDYKITSTKASSHIAFNIFDGNDWDNYCGYYDVYADYSKPEYAYAGFSYQLLSDDYVRVTINISQLNKINGTKPANINTFYISGQNTDATGYIDFISLKEGE